MRGERIKPFLRPAALVVALAATLFIGGLWPEPAHAQPALTVEASCSPDTVRPNVDVLITCDVSVTNTGDAIAPELSATLGEVDDCAPVIFFQSDSIGYRINGGPLIALPVSSQTFAIGDLDPGATVDAQLLMVTSAFFPGQWGGEFVAYSDNDTSIRGSAPACWTVAADSPNPPTRLQVTKHLSGPGGGPIFIDEEEIAEPQGFPGGGFPEPPPRPDDGMPVPIEFPPPPQTAEYVITVSNASDAEVTDVSVYDVQTGAGAILQEAEPPPDSRDAAARPTWQLGSLAAGGSTTIEATYGPSQAGICAYISDIAIITATPAGGSPETYVARADSGAQTGECEPIGGSGLCWHYPPVDDQEPIVESCNFEVCWLVPPDGQGFEPLYRDCNQQYCWFYPPKGGEPTLRTCGEDVCWITFSGGFIEGDVRPAGHEGGGLSPIDCGEQICDFTSPDGTQTRRENCDAGYCWTTAPDGSFVQAMRGDCDRTDVCWFSTPDGGAHQVSNCELDICFIQPPPGAMQFFGGGFSDLCEYIDEYGDICWPVPPNEGEFFSEPRSCGRGGEVCWATSPEGPIFQVPCGEPFCWVRIGDVFPDIGLPPDLLVPLTFACGELPTEFGVPGGSEVQGVVVEGVSSPAVFEEGTVEPVELLATDEVRLAFVARPEYVPGPPPPQSPPVDNPDDDDDTPPPDAPDFRSPSEKLADVLGLTGVSGLPDSGDGPPGGDPPSWLWALLAAVTAAGLALGGAGVAWRRRREL
jgi:hypothetical protein